MAGIVATLPIPRGRKRRMEGVSGGGVHFSQKARPPLPLPPPPPPDTNPFRVERKGDGHQTLVCLLPLFLSAIVSSSSSSSPALLIGQIPRRAAGEEGIDDVRAVLHGASEKKDESIDSPHFRLFPLLPIIFLSVLLPLLFAGEEDTCQPPSRLLHLSIRQSPSIPPIWPH